MKQRDVNDEIRTAGPGVCHRCGWTAMVVKVSRRDRRTMAVDSSVRRLCDECVGDLDPLRRMVPAPVAKDVVVRRDRRSRVA